MKFKAALLMGLTMLLLSSPTTTEARRRACRLWNCGVGPINCLDDYSCAPCGPVCEPKWQEVECTVMVPETSYETRRVMTTQYTHEVRQRPVTYYERVPRTEVRQVSYTVCDPVKREKTVPHVTCRPVYEDREVSYNYCEPVYEQKVGYRTVCRAEWDEVPYEYTVMVPRTEWHTGVRKVCHMEPVTAMRTVCVDEGCWVDNVVAAPCCNIGCGPGNCGCYTVCRPIICRRWQPNIVQKQIPYMTCRPVYVDQEYRYCTTVCEPQTRTCTRRVCRMVPEKQEYTYTVCHMEQKTAVRNVRVCRYVQETSERVVHYTEMVPRTETREEKYTVYDCVPHEKMVDYTVCVPVQVEKEIQVPVCHMVPKTIVKRIPVPCSTCPGNTCY